MTFIDWPRAVKCMEDDCGCVSDGTLYCPRCGSTALLNLARVLDREDVIIQPGSKRDNDSIFIGGEHAHEC